MAVKSIHELAKEFPEKTYRQLEIYRDADRQEEAQRIITQQENEELKEDQGKEIDYHRYWKDQYEKEHKLREKAEKELEDLKKKVDPAHITQKARESGL